MPDDDVQFPLGGWSEPDPDAPPEFDEWDQQIDETEDEWNARLERARLEAEDISTSKVEIQRTVESKNDEDFKEWSNQVQEAVKTGGPLPENTEVRVTACPPPTSPMTADALLEMANAALEKINSEKAAKKREKAEQQMRVVSETVGPKDYIQESFLSAECVNLGGTGLECMMCNGQACRYCGYGCWAMELPKCEHEIEQRHSWDPELKDARRDQMEADLKKLEISEARREEMLARIFDGEPSRPTVVYCQNCNQEIRTGEVVFVTGTGSKHAKNCNPEGTLEIS